MSWVFDEYQLLLTTERERDTERERENDKMRDRKILHINDPYADDVMTCSASYVLPL